MFISRTYVSLLTLAFAVGLSACDKADTDGEGASTAPETPAAAPKKQPLVLKLEDRTLTVTGDGPRGFAAGLRDASEAFTFGSCRVRHMNVELRVPVDGPQPSPPLPFYDLAPILCHARTADITFDWEALTAKGSVVLHDLKVDPELLTKYTERVGYKWTFSLNISIDDGEIPAGFGRLVVSSFDDSHYKTWSVVPVVDGEPFDEPIEDGTSILLKPGIYAASNGDHFGIRDGFETVFVLGNPAAIFFGGRRFPLDDTVPMDDHAVALGPKSTNEYSIDSCAVRADLMDPRCGQRKAQSGEPIEIGNIEKVRSVVNQAVLHIDGCHDVAMARRVLVSKNISTHVAIDFDGTVHQIIDLSLAAFHTAAADNQSIGFDFNNMMENLVRHPDALPYPENHPRIKEMRLHPRPKSKVKDIAFMKSQSYGFTEAQWRSGVSVTRLLLRLFPNLAPDYPRDRLGVEHIGYPLEEPGKFRGFMAHYAWEANRWDPGPGFDWPRLVKAFDPKSRP